MSDPRSYRPEAGTIPDEPGVYRFRDPHGRVLYVGKAKSLRSRLANYFSALSGLHPRTQAMVTSAASVDWPIGASGYDVRMNVDLSGNVPHGFFVTPIDGAGVAGVNAPIGSFDPGLAGAHIYAQWLVLGDAGGKPTVYGAPVAASTGLSLRIGL